MYAKLPNLVIGFHGCSEQTFDDVIRKGIPLKSSKNDYDWLGSGIYFWEQNYERAKEWAVEQAARKDGYKPAVIGAVIDLGNCLNLTDSKYIELLEEEYKLLREDMELTGQMMPQNTWGGDKLLRRLDCAVVEHLHARIQEMVAEDENQVSPFDSARGLFSEGKEIYPNAGFKRKTHVQICIRNPNCIKGVFSPMAQAPDWIIP